MKVDLKDCITGKKAKFKTIIELSVSEDDLLINFDASNSTFNSYSNKYNDDLFNGDVCEIFLDVGKPNYYYEIESTPDGTLFFAEIYNDGKTRKINYLTNDFIYVKTEKNACNYEVFFKIKYKLMGINIDETKINLFRIETEGIRPDKNLFALSPTFKNTFHVPEKFILLKTLIYFNE